MAGTYLAADSVIGLTGKKCFVNGFAFLLGGSVNIFSADFFIPCLHGFPTGGTVNDTVEDVVVWAVIARHNSWTAVDQFLHLRPFFRGNDGFMAVFNNFPIFTGNEFERTGTDARLVRPAHEMCALVKRIAENVADSCRTPCVVVGIQSRICFHTGNGDFLFQQLLGNSHIAHPIKGVVVDFADNGCCIRVDDKMPFVFRVAHQTIGRSAAAELALPGTGHDASQNFLGNVTAVHVVQDVLERGNVHFLPGQTVHTIRDSNISNMMFRKENLDITASFDIVAAKPGKVFRDNTVDFPGFDVGNHPLERRTIEIAPGVAIVHIVFVAEHSVLFRKVLQHQLLVADAHALIFAPIFQRKAAIEGSDFLDILFLSAHSFFSYSMSRDTTPL